MAQVIMGGAETFNALAYGKQHPNLQKFLHQQQESFSQNLNEAGMRYAERARSVYEKLNNSDAMRIARAIGRKAKSIWQCDEILPLTNIGQLQQAAPKMQRWIMAEPSIRKLYHSGQCDGYTGSYVDMSPKDIGENHYDYRRVMDGMFVENEDGDLESISYLDEVDDGDDLMIEEQTDILLSWSAVQRAVIEYGDDCTSKWNSSL